MKQITLILFTSFFMLSLFNACGPSEEEVRQQQQARQDSLERVQQQQQNQQPQDTMSQMEQDTAAASDTTGNEADKMAEEEKSPTFNFDKSGHIAVQVEAWRSREKAEAQVSKWVNRGFESAYVVKHGNPETGDIWFRVRLGKVSSLERAKQLGKNLQEAYNVKYWVANVQKDEPESDSDTVDNEEM